MNITMTKKDLLAVVAAAVGSVDSKSTMPVLANVLLDAGNDVRAVGTDLYRTTLLSRPAHVAVLGSIALPAKDLLERVKAMPDGSIQINLSDGQASIRAVGAARRYKLPFVPGSEFPQVPSISDDAIPVTLTAGALLRLLAQTAFAVSTDETRPHVNSLLMKFGDDATFVSTDGNRMSIAHGKVEPGSAITEFLLPLQAVTELRRHASDLGSEDYVKIRCASSVASFDLGDVTFISKLVDAQFPPYMKVLPEKATKLATVPRAALLDAVKAVALACGKTSGVRMTISTDMIEITASDPGAGDGADEVGANYAGPDLQAGFNAKYMRDVLVAIETDEVSLSMRGELDPLRIDPVGDESSVFVIMPMRM